MSNGNCNIQFICIDTTSEFPNLRPHVCITFSSILVVFIQTWFLYFQNTKKRKLITSRSIWKAELWFRNWYYPNLAQLRRIDIIQSTKSPFCNENFNHEKNWYDKKNRNVNFGILMSKSYSKMSSCNCFLTKLISKMQCYEVITNCQFIISS